ncbi:MAG: hypothetical protein IPL90_09390 [Holophagales bacterium]|nr:hypothetical protein [Holophagales bacterium]
MAAVVPLKPVLRALAACAALAAAVLLAYENDGRTRAVKGGPHRAINRLAVERFFAEKQSDPILSRYDLSRSKKLLGETYVSGDMFRPGTGDRAATFTRWIEEGGYTADEPELYASFRHFYDPLAWNAEDHAFEGLSLGPQPGAAPVTPGGGAPYLTDDLNSLNKLYSAITGSAVNPRIHAKEWAIDGPENNGWGENPYCWKRGLEYVEKAFAETGPEKQRLWAKAWRSLGETMHLLADMTSVPHVRNDSHPSASSYLGEYSDHVGRLRSDPYETLAQEALVVASAGGPLPDISLRDTPEELFDAVAHFTNSSFFSADTIAGRDPVTGDEVTNANGLRPYPSPRLEECRDEGGYFVKDVAGRPVRMAHRSWLEAAGWGQAMHHVRLSSACVKDQAAVLVPLALAANARLVDLFLPRVRVDVEEVDPVAKKLRGNLVHVPYGAYGRALRYSSGGGEVQAVYLDGSIQWLDKYKIEIRDGVIEGDLSGLDLKKGQTLRLDVEVGGIMVKGNDVLIGDDFLARLHRTKYFSVVLVAPGDVRYKVRSVLPDDDRAGTRPEPHAGIRFEGQLPAAPGNVPVRIPISWSGSSFSAGSEAHEASRCMICGGNHDDTHTFSVSGSVDLAKRTLSLDLSYRSESRPAPGCEMAQTAGKLGLTDRIYFEQELHAVGVPLDPDASGDFVTFEVEGPAVGKCVTSGNVKNGGIGIRIAEQFPSTSVSELVAWRWDDPNSRPQLSVYLSAHP